MFISPRWFCFAQLLLSVTSTVSSGFVPTASCNVTAPTRAAIEPPIFISFHFFFSPTSSRGCVVHADHLDPPQRCCGGEPQQTPRFFPAPSPLLFFVPCSGPVFRSPRCKGPRPRMGRSGKGGMVKWLPPPEMIRDRDRGHFGRLHCYSRHLICA